MLGFHPFSGSPFLAVLVPLLAMFFKPFKPAPGASLPFPPQPLIANRSRVGRGSFDLEATLLPAGQPLIELGALQGGFFRKPFSTRFLGNLPVPLGVGISLELMLPDVFPPLVGELTATALAGDRRRLCVRLNHRSGVLLQ